MQISAPPCRQSLPAAPSRTTLAPQQVFVTRKCSLSPPRRCSRPSTPAHRLHMTAAGQFDAGEVAAPGLQEELRKALDDFISQNKIVLFMKGTQQFPQCGFSNTCVQIFHALEVPGDQYTCVNILEDESLRAGLKEYSMWPTFPQVYIDGEFYGGCDVMIEGFTNGELKETVERVLAS